MEHTSLKSFAVRVGIMVAVVSHLGLADAQTKKTNPIDDDEIKALPIKYPNYTKQDLKPIEQFIRDERNSGNYKDNDSIAVVLPPNFDHTQNLNSTDIYSVEAAKIKKANKYAIIAPINPQALPKTQNTKVAPQGAQSVADLVKKEVDEVKQNLTDGYDPAQEDVTVTIGDTFDRSNTANLDGNGQPLYQNSANPNDDTIDSMNKNIAEQAQFKQQVIAQLTALGVPAKKIKFVVNPAKKWPAMATQNLGVLVYAFKADGIKYATPQATKVQVAARTPKTTAATAATAKTTATTSTANKSTTAATGGTSSTSTKAATASKTSTSSTTNSSTTAKSTGTTSTATTQSATASTTATTPVTAATTAATSTNVNQTTTSTTAAAVVGTTAPPLSVSIVKKPVPVKVIPLPPVPTQVIPIKTTVVQTGGQPSQPNNSTTTPASSASTAPKTTTTASTATVQKTEPKVDVKPPEQKVLPPVVTTTKPPEEVKKPPATTTNTVSNGGGKPGKPDRLRQSGPRYTWHPKHKHHYHASVQKRTPKGCGKKIKCPKESPKVVGWFTEYQ